MNQKCSIFKTLSLFDLEIMHDLEAVDIRIFWQQQIMVTQYKPRAMIFVLTCENLTSLILHCLLRPSYYQHQRFVLGQIF